MAMLNNQRVHIHMCVYILMYVEGSMDKLSICPRHPILYHAESCMLILYVYLCNEQKLLRILYMHIEYLNGHAIEIS
jgi:hypothetical protein